MKTDFYGKMKTVSYRKPIVFLICTIMLFAVTPVFGDPGEQCCSWVWEKRGRNWVQVEDCDRRRDCQEHCISNSTIRSWTGDRYCDDGAYWDGSNWVFLNCDTFECDGGDCECESPDQDCYRDADNDGHGNPNVSVRGICADMPGYVESSDDCNDSEAASYPGNPEICDGIDNDCANGVDDGLGVTYYLDDDGDGYGDASQSTLSCSGVPSGYVLDNTDCNDGDTNINPGATEICDGKDNDCANGVDDGLLVAYYLDGDGDGYGGTSVTMSCSGAPSGYVDNNDDCNDGNADINPDADEICDGIDNDCDGVKDDGLDKEPYYFDSDHDGFGDPNVSLLYCDDDTAALDFYVKDNTDCDDSEAASYPGNPEICDGLDNDCANGVDDGLLVPYYLDDDEDGYGDASQSTMSCSGAPSGYVDNDQDCDDSNALINPDATEICDDSNGLNLIDENCDGSTPACDVGEECHWSLEWVGGGQQEWVSYGQVDCNGDCQWNWQITDWGNDPDCNSELQCDFYNWDGGQCAVIADCYIDVDRDGYGDGFGATMSAPCADGYVDKTMIGDCDDLEPAINPAAVEICDGFDNDCDGDVDEGLTLFTYYLDSDGDGYGNPANAMAACGPPANYVSDNTDCNDNNPLINPGAYDICQNGVDDDCQGGDRICGEIANVCANLSDIPLETQVEAAPPIVMLLVDDSGSMAWDMLCPEKNGNFSGYSNYSSVKPYWKSQYSGYNGIYYNPDVDYSPWPDSGSTEYDDANRDTPRYHPDQNSTRTLGDQFESRDSVSVKWSHYYAWSTIESAPYLINITGSNGSYSLDYYKVTDCSNGACTSDHSKVDDYVIDNTPPADVESLLTPAEERQNFANWFQYHRTRQLTAIAALANVVNSVEGMKIGMHSVNHSVNMIAPRLVDDYRGDILDDLYDVAASGGTPLRRGLRDVGNYYSGTYSSRLSPYSNSSNGGDCQQAYTIMMTDGYWNGGDPGVGNTDGPADAAGNTDYDGWEFGDSYSNTLADVAMKYYENDLSSGNDGLANLVPTSSQDSATHQHMVTYSVSFGLEGLYDPDDYQGCPQSNCPDWPNVTSSSEDERSITDLWHAAVNGRGKYMQANNAQQLAYALITLMQDVSKREGSGASVAVNSHELKQGSRMYQGTYNSAGWTGDVKAYNINPLTGAVDADHPAWSAAHVLDARVTASGHTDRDIYTMGSSGGVAFTYANIGSLSNYQQTALGDNAVAQENMINFIRGDFSKDENHNGSFRARITRLGDIVHSEPKFVNNYLYVGGNDGMFHVFSAATGEEVFAYIPSFVFSNLDELANPDYTHRYFVDLSPFLGYDANGDVLLIGGLGKGGKGYFCLDVDVTNPASFAATDVKWEYPDAGSSGNEFANMGYTFAEPAIVYVENGSHVLIFGNGYDSENARAVLYVLNPTTGNLIKMIDTGYGSADANNCNGLSTPVYIDTNNNGKVDTVYAGDLRGNVWKFDISGAFADWDVAYKDGDGNSKSLFQAKDAAGNAQPITTRVAVKGHCVKGYSGYMVIFGTGKFNSSTDFTDTSTQAVYGIWDWAPEWDEEDPSGDSSDKYFGAYNSPSTGNFSNLAGHSDLSGVGNQLTLLAQGQAGSAVYYNDTYWRTTSANEINWFDVKRYLDPAETYGDDADEGYHVGWVFALPYSGERVVADPVLWLNYALIVSQEPAENMCQVGGSAYLRALNVCSGSAPLPGDPPFFPEEPPDDGPWNEIELPDFITYPPTMIEDKIYFGPEEDENYEVLDYPAGILFWRYLNMN